MSFPSSNCCALSFRFFSPHIAPSQAISVRSVRGPAMAPNTQKSFASFILEVDVWYTIMFIPRHVYEIEEGQYLTYTLRSNAEERLWPTGPLTATSWVGR